MESVISLRNVWKKYDMGLNEPLVVLKGINLEIEKGDFTIILGPSGSGKSSMVNIVGALDRPSWGEVYLKNKNISRMNSSSLAFLRGRTIGFIFQQFNLVPTLSALENVMLPMEMVDTPTSYARRRSLILLDLMGLGDRINHRPNELSGGQQQRVAIARALANDPEIILADEPTGNLDTKTGEFIMQFLEKANEEGKTIILITHEADLVKYANKIVNIRDGEIQSIKKRKFNKINTGR